MPQPVNLTVRLEEGKAAAAARELLQVATSREWKLTVEFALQVVCLQEEVASQCRRLYQVVEVDR